MICVMTTTPEKLEKRKWLIMFYTFTDNNLEECTFKDLAKITDYDGDRSSIYMKLLIDTHSMGSYDITVTGNPYIDHNTEMTRRHDMNMSDSTNFLSYLSDAIKKYPAEHHMLILGGHGNGWFLDMEEGYDPNRTCMSSAKVASLLKQLNINIDILCFDNCLMATIDNIAHFNGIVKFITACEDYCPSNGVINKNICKMLNMDHRKMGVNIVDGFIESNPREITDITLFDVSENYKLFEFVKKLDVTSDEFYNVAKTIHGDPFKFCVDKSYVHLQDLYSFMEAKYCTMLPDPDKKIFNKFSKLFGNAVITYKQTKIKKNEYHHGISCIVYPNAMNSFDKVLYGELKYTCIFPENENKYVKCSSYVKSSRIPKRGLFMKNSNKSQNESHDKQNKPAKKKKAHRSHLRKNIIYLL